MSTPWCARGNPLVRLNRTQRVTLTPKSGPIVSRGVVYEPRLGEVGISR